ncbi:MAG: CoA transferase [Pseudomonadota bacterium]
MPEPILNGLRVIDAASYIAAPVAATILADFGADVVKVENPGGDTYRALNSNPGMAPADNEFHWHLTNHNKRGIGLDLGNPAGYEVLQRLVSNADVFITNFPPPSRARLKLTYGDLGPLNERLIYAALSAYGEAGPEAARSGFDSTAYWARSGLMHAVRPDPDSGPARSMPGQGDHPTGMALFGAIMLALYDRQRTGQGAEVHTSLLANGVWANGYAAQATLAGTSMPLRPPREQAGNALTNHYQTRDGRWFILTVLNQDRDWPRLIAAIGRPELADDPRFADRATRNAHPHELCAALDAAFATADLAHWRQVLGEAGLIIGVVGTADETGQDAQMAACGVVRTTGLGQAGIEKLIDSPLWIAGHDKADVTAAPGTHQHRDEVLSELGYSEAECHALANQGAFGKPG